jgi:hypothetical protein
MPRRTGLEVAVCFPNNQAAAISALRAYGSSPEGNIVEPPATNEKTPAKQTAVIRKKWIPNQTTWMRFENISWDGTDRRPGRPSLSLRRSNLLVVYGAALRNFTGVSSECILAQATE